jgi:hypothetical protein
MAAGRHVHGCEVERLVRGQVDYRFSLTGHLLLKLGIYWITSCRCPTCGSGDTVDISTEKYFHTGNTI